VVTLEAADNPEKHPKFNQANVQEVPFKPTAVQLSSKL